MTPMDLTQFSTRTRNCLRVTDGLYFVEQIAAMTDKELLAIPNLGKWCLAEIRNVIPQKHCNCL